MALLPPLRPIELIGLEIEGEPMVALKDPLSLTTRTMLVSPAMALLLGLMDGRHTLEELCANFAKIARTEIDPAYVVELIEQLDENFLLDNERAHSQIDQMEAAYRREAIRTASRAGLSYPEDPRELKSVLDACLDQPGIQRSQQASVPRALLAPHIDFDRGGRCYGLSYSQIGKLDQSVTFVILGTGHGGVKGLVSAARKDFQTPLGLARVDHLFLDRLEDRSLIGLGKDALCHRNEHSIEFQVVFLQHLLGEPERFTIVPILVGSFQHFLKSRSHAADDPQYSGFLRALAATIAQHECPVCVIGAVDLSHMGPRFGHDGPMDEPKLEQLRRSDLEMLERVCAWDPAGFYARIAEEEDRRNVCGFSSIYTLLSIIEPSRGRLLGYEQSMDESGSVVSFCSLVFPKTG